MKRLASVLLALIFSLTTAMPILAVDNPAFSIKVSAELDNVNPYENESTLVLDWQIMANREGLTLRNTQGLRLSYDNTVLQLMKWDGTGVIADGARGTGLVSTPQTGLIGKYNSSLSIYTAQDVSGEVGYISIAVGDRSRSYACPQGEFVTLAQIRFTFRKGKSVDKLAEGSIRSMTVSELAATAQSSAVLLNTTENDATTYMYLRQERGAAVGGDTLNAPVFIYPNSTVKIEKDKESSINTDNESSDTTQVGTQNDLDYINPYDDISSTEWFYGAVKYVTESEIMNGTGNGRFSPNTPLTRAMFATILHRLEGKPEINGQLPDSNAQETGDMNVTFSDVPEGQWYSDAVLWASENGLIKGYGSNLFGPNDTITREQVVTILYRYSEFCGFDISGRADLSDYTDAAQISDWAQDAMEWAVSAEVISGRSPTTLVPQGQMTRAEVAQVLKNFAQNDLSALADH